MSEIDELATSWDVLPKVGYIYGSRQRDPLMTVDLSSTANRCPECGAAELYTRQTHAPGDKYGSVLDGLGGIFSHPTVNVVLCAGCGLLRLFADPDAFGEVRSHKDWKRIP